MWVKPGLLDLTYCTNIHAGERWSEVRASVEEYALPLKASLSPQAPFGLGLRLSAQAAQELRTGEALNEFRAFLEANRLYVAIINGFPFGSFHGEVVKTSVFAPDWRDPARLAYTLDLVAILAALLPEGMDGGISTIPLSYKPWGRGDAQGAWPQICTQLAELTAALVQLCQSTGKRVHLDIEPEPNGLVETTDEVVDFFHGPLLSLGVPALAKRLGITPSEAEQHLREHLQVCFDICHMAIQFENPVASLERLQAEAIGVGRLQISSALRIPLSIASTAATLQKELAMLEDPIYLHQVVERTGAGALRRFPDLEDALADVQARGEAEWRIHFHVPLYADRFGPLLTTQSENMRVLQFAMERNITAHLEVETYTWHVLPAQHKVDLHASILRELQWAREQTTRQGLCTRQ